jgi:hypothetical protein
MHRDRQPSRPPTHSLCGICAMYLPTCPDSYELGKIKIGEQMVIDRKSLLFHYYIALNKYESEHSRKFNLIKEEIIYGTLKGQNG